MELVSIIMPAYDASQYIKESIDSVLAQTYQNWELLIVDDCSTDKTAEVVALFNDRRIMLYKTPRNSGAGIARNIGICKAKGRYIAFIDGDDWWYPEKLEKQLAFMQQHHYEFTCTWYEDSDINLTPYHVSRPHDKQDFAYMRCGNEVGTPGVIYDAARIGKIFMPEYHRGEDWTTWLNILQKVDYLHVCPFVSFKYRHNEKSVTQNKWKMAQAVINVYKNELHYSSLRAWLVFLFRFMPRNISRKLKKI